MDLAIQRNPPDHSAERRAQTLPFLLLFFSSLSFIQFENLASILKLPGKKTFNNMDRDFLEKRKKDLNAYLQVSEAPARLQRDTQVLLGVGVVVVFLHRLNNACVCVAAAAQPRDGEGLSHPHLLRLRLPGEQSLQQGEGRVCTQGAVFFSPPNRPQSPEGVLLLPICTSPPRLPPSPPLPSPRQIDTFVNPLRSSMRNVSNAVKGLPDSLAEGMNKVSDNVGRMGERLGQDIKQSILKVPPLLPKTDIDPEHRRVSAQLDDNVRRRSQRSSKFVLALC